ncbi:MAG: GTPase ObgE [Oscillospiraceae bacterium]|nr:GTPase ObgE [Oscillospiraceae bacterium]
MFIDVAEITLSSGRGGNGSVSFHREKYVSAGGPDGGDGGRGGSVYIQADDNLSTLMDFRYKREYAAQNGADGGSRGRTGKDGADLTIRVPRGTLIKDAGTGRLLHDASGPEPFLLLGGGRGGWGNRRFATPTRQAPRFAKSGQDGLTVSAALELKLLADVGLVGFPNAGKSSLLSAISAARPKVAGYPFTTLSPNLGMVRVDDRRSFVAADIPGLIEGASGGAGLGHDFLRHVDRCRLLLHVIDASGLEGRDPLESYDAINEELARYSPELAARPQIVVANKRDIWPDGDILDRLTAHCAPRAVMAVSAAARLGVEALAGAAAAMLDKLPPVAVFTPDYVPEREPSPERDFTVTRGGDAVWVVEGAWLERVMRDVRFDDHESMRFFDRALRRAGVFDLLEARGAEEGDTVRMFDLEFEYVP